jgi:hypothetical protein
MLGEIGLAFGRERAIHAALAAGGLTTRVVEEAARLAGLRGSDGQHGGGETADEGYEGRMSDTDGKKPLGLGGAPRSGQVKQSFSHGRTHAVVVETKRKRVVVPTPANRGRGDGAQGGAARPIWAIRPSARPAFPMPRCSVG